MTRSSAESVEQFTNLTGCKDPERAQLYLEKSNLDVNDAVSRYQKDQADGTGETMKKQCCCWMVLECLGAALFSVFWAAVVGYIIVM